MSTPNKPHHLHRRMTFQKSMRSLVSKGHSKPQENRKTGIVCTIGPASANLETLKELVRFVPRNAKMRSLCCYREIVMDIFFLSCCSFLDDPCDFSFFSLLGFSHSCTSLVYFTLTILGTSVSSFLTFLFRLSHETDYRWYECRSSKFLTW